MSNQLAIYLNDHLAGAAGGVALARRIAGSRGGGAADDARRLAGEIAEDRDTLVRIVSRLRMRRTFYKEPLALVAERLGRFKPNGAVLTRAPMSDVVEYEALLLGITGKRSMWRTLRVLTTQHTELDASELDALITRADQQLELVERMRLEAAGVAFAGASS